MADTSVGIAFNNLGLAWAGGALTGAAIAYWKRSYIYLLLGPLGGYVAAQSAFDVYKPWQMFLVALGAPIVCYGCTSSARRVAGTSTSSPPSSSARARTELIMVGLVSWGTDKGVLRPDRRRLRLPARRDQRLLAAPRPDRDRRGRSRHCVGLAFILERTTGLRLSEEEQVAGVDAGYWDLVGDLGQQSSDGVPLGSRAGAGDSTGRRGRRLRREAGRAGALRCARAARASMAPSATQLP